MFNPFSLHNKTILITGASSGIGWSTAIEMANQGAKIIATGRDELKLTALLRNMPNATESHSIFACDLTETECRKRLVSEISSLDGVVLSAGIQHLAPIKLISEAMIDGILNVNLKSPIMLLQSLLRANKLKEGCSIVFLSSIAAHSGTEGNGAYAASKGGLESFVKVAALEFGKRKIRVNALAPGMVITPIYKEKTPTWFEPYAARYPLGLGKPEDVASAATFLISDAAHYITGTSIVMDGGCTHI